MMEHFKSTIATTAVLVAGLIMAAHVLHPRDPAFETRRGKPVAAATAWSDPPVRAAEPAATVAAMRTPRPASFTLLPVAMTASLSGPEITVQPRRVRKVELAHGQKLVQLGNRGRSAPVGPGARAELPTASAQPGKPAPVDPIGALLNTLGIGRDSEG